MDATWGSLCCWWEGIAHEDGLCAALYSVMRVVVSSNKVFCYYSKVERTFTAFNVQGFNIEI